MRTRLLTTRWSQLPKDAVRKLQVEKLRHYLKSVVMPFSTHYQELFRQHGIQPEKIRHLEDLEAIPFTNKEDLVNTPERPQRARDFVIIPNQSDLARRPSTIFKALTHGRQYAKRQLEVEYRPIFMTSTTGRSADPIPFLYTQHDLVRLGEAGNRVMQVCGADREWRLINMFPFAPHLAFWLTHYASTDYGIFTVGTGGGKVMGTDGNLRLIGKIKPDVLIGMPTFIYHVMQQALDAGMRCENLKRLVLGGEKVADGIRKKLRGLARKLGSGDVDILATYGFTEAKMAWAECPHPAGQESGGYHLYPDMGVFEVVDPKTGALRGPGEPGELVYTPMDARGTAVVRYRTGDVIDGGLFYDACPHCGRTLPRLVGRISRNSEIRAMKLDKVKGTLVDFNQLEHVLDDAPNVLAWQLELRKVNDDPMELDELILHVQAKDGVSREKLARDLSSLVVERTEISPNRFAFHTAEEIRHLLGVGVELKEQKIIDNRPGKGNAFDKVAGSSSETTETPAEGVADGSGSGSVENKKPSESQQDTMEVTT